MLTRPVMQMKRFFLAVSAICSLSPAFAGINDIPDEVRDACLPAADFAGCVKAFTGKEEDKGANLDRFGFDLVNRAFISSDSSKIRNRPVFRTLERAALPFATSDLVMMSAGFRG